MEYEILGNEEFDIGEELELVGDYDDDFDEYDELEELLGAARARSRGGRRRSPYGQPAGRWAARGARRSASRGRERALTRRAVAVEVAAARAQRGTLLKKTVPQNSREYPIGFDSGSDVPGLGSATLRQQPQIIFRPERLVIVSAIASFFNVEDIKVGKNSQTVASGAIPASSFAETAFGVRMKLDTAQISQDIILSVTNIDAAPHRFRATFFGEAVE